MEPPLPPDLVVRTDADLTALWRIVLGDLRFGDRLLWILVLGPGDRAGGPLLQITDLPDGPYGVPLEDLAAFVGEILDADPGGLSVALLMTRPGTGPWHVGDRAWTRYLQTAAGLLGARTWPVHRARTGVLEACPLS